MSVVEKDVIALIIKGNTQSVSYLHFLSLRLLVSIVFLSITLGFLILVSLHLTLMRNIRLAINVELTPPRVSLASQCTDHILEKVIIVK